MQQKTRRPTKKKNAAAQTAHRQFTCVTCVKETTNRVSTCSAKRSDVLKKQMGGMKAMVIDDLRQPLKQGYYMLTLPLLWLERIFTC